MQELTCQEENIKKITEETINSFYNKDIKVSVGIYCMDPNREIYKLFNDLDNPNSLYYNYHDEIEHEDKNWKIWEKIDDFLKLFIKRNNKWLFNEFAMLDIHYTIMNENSNPDKEHPYTTITSGKAYTIQNMSSSTNDNYPDSTNITSAVLPTKEIHQKMFIDSLNVNNGDPYSRDSGIVYKVLTRLNYLINLENSENNYELKNKYKYILTLPTILSRCRSVRMINITNKSNMQVVARKKINNGEADLGRWKITDINKISPTMPLIASRSNEYTINAGDVITSDYWGGKGTDVCDDEYVLSQLKWFVDQMLEKVNQINLNNFEFGGFYLEEFPTSNYTQFVINGIIDYIKGKNKDYRVTCSPTAEYYHQQKVGTDAYQDDEGRWFGYHYHCPEHPEMSIWPRNVLGKCKFDDVYVQLNGGLINRSNDNLEETLDYIYTNFLNFTLALDSNTVNNMVTIDKCNVRINNNLTGPINRLKQELDRIENNPERNYLDRNWNFYCEYDSLKYVYEFIDYGTINGEQTELTPADVEERKDILRRYVNLITNLNQENF